MSNTKSPQTSQKQPQAAAAPPPVPRVKVIAFVEDTAEGMPMTWAVVQGTVPIDALEIEKVIRENNAGMAKAHALALVDATELLRP